MPIPSVTTQIDMALHHVATTIDFAVTIAQRGVGMANRIRTVRSANSRPKIHEVRKATGFHHQRRLPVRAARERSASRRHLR